MIEKYSPVFAEGKLNRSMFILSLKEMIVVSGMFCDEHWKLV